MAMNSIEIAEFYKSLGIKHADFSDMEARWLAVKASWNAVGCSISL
jgi:hypothetical protein